MRILFSIPIAFCLAASPPLNASGPELRGMALGAYVHMTRDELLEGIREIAALGANAVLLKVSETQEGWRSSFIAPDPHLTLPALTIEFLLREIGKHGLHAVLMPIVLLRKPQRLTEWRGMIEPEDRARWFSSYAYMIEKYARMAGECGAHALAVGSELSSMERYEDEWASVIARARQAFGGKLFYSANWDHLSRSQAWSELDWLGVSAYFELHPRGAAPSRAAVRKSWARARKPIEAWARSLSKPLLITEIGYPSRRDALADPWNHPRKDVFDPAAQALGYEEFIRAWRGSGVLAGVLFYEWVGPGGDGDIGYTPKGKPAATILQEWMRRE